MRNINFKVDHHLLLTMIDGKVCQVLTGTASASTCVICGAVPTEMNKPEKLKQKLVLYLPKSKVFTHLK